MKTQDQKGRKWSRYKARRQEYSESDANQSHDESCTEFPGNKYRELELTNDALHGHLTLSRKLQKAVNQLRDDKAAEAQREFEKQRKKIKAELSSERAQNCILAEELVRQTRSLEQCQIACQADEELLRRLQSQCYELRAQRAEAELQLVEFEGDNRRATDRTREELVARVNQCLRGYTL
ncbi:hypothetical protein AXG93_1757s1150 [Marchantia polymorpha subsp. ruderalis]|uniref:Uncharacterized protein n=1 Tax=Marchantia polymorpha subsp. ruderalis TaxID=1480154 RepID=A0A176WPS5_MARPO|nr:hypothetical protein AXG93_1757s1150 [Marchantia polymorpha subsp. ruderalis]